MNKKQNLRSHPVALLLLSPLILTSAEERINLDRPNIPSDDIAKILPSKRSNNFEKLHLLKNNFRTCGLLSGKAFIFKFIEASKLKHNQQKEKTKI